MPFAITGKSVDLRGKTWIGFEAGIQLNRLDHGGLLIGETVEIELASQAIQHPNALDLRRIQVHRVARDGPERPAAGNCQQGVVHRRLRT
ncbi:hypothetical protein NKDENANG_02040 [Candidatus Entotheonellaceae bacterium PAL068K]